MLRSRKQSEREDRQAFLAAVDCLQESQNALRRAADKLKKNLTVNGVILEKIGNPRLP